jgi:DNA-binding GntR family transcriptional regulator
LTGLECNWYTTGTMDTLMEEPGVPDEADSRPLSVVAYAALLDMILRGALGSGELVTERQIAARLGMSRTPVREAVHRLEGEGTLERQRSGALVVRPYSMEEFLHVLAVRRLLEGEAARLAGGRIAPQALADARARIARLRAAGLGETARGDDQDFHAAIAEASGNPVLATSLGDLRKRTAMFRLGRLPGPPSLRACGWFRRGFCDRRGAGAWRRRGRARGHADPHRQCPRGPHGAAERDLTATR